MKKWTAVEYDLTKKLMEGAQPKRVTIKPGMKLELIIELDDKVYAKLSKDSVWIQRMQTKANEKAKPTIELAIQMVKKADEKAAMALQGMETGWNQGIDKLEGELASTLTGH